MRILILVLLLSGLAATTASAKTIDASEWKGKLIVMTTFKHQYERHETGHDNVRHGDADHPMSGRLRLLLPHRAGQRSQWLTGSGSLDQLKDSVRSTYMDANPRRTIDVSCAGRIRNGGEILQARTEIGYSGALKLIVDGFSLMPKERCSAPDYRSPTAADGWPEDWVFALPAAPQRGKRLELQSDWWRFRSTCGIGEEREGSGVPPGVVTTSEDGFVCISGDVVRIHTLLDLRRVCRQVKLTVTSSSSRKRCVRR